MILIAYEGLEISTSKLYFNGINQLYFYYLLSKSVVKHCAQFLRGSYSEYLTSSSLQQVSQIDNDLKARASAYNNLKGNLQNLERKNAGSLLTRSLADIVKKEDFVIDSEYLITMLVVVPKTSYADWQKTYETLSEMVVPRSTK
ncbi:unnamed protein product [Oncorhynchus mykiss]|uniref:V-type proton ATPase subunit C n=1 Tax=Oncorhynchus mykiss TaxID=8022 RepID=A0A060ZG28_ONCMY|nr:unnamed protein product [Oncorhynchus mykiss]